MLKTIAFYLPQFHPIPENDAWWGPGFTEWNNVRQATPQFEDHYQPHIPHRTLGYYDLRDQNLLIRQHRIAEKFGLFGFCYYYYYFNGKTLLDTPLKIIRNTPQIQTNYCLCWANGNWTRAWYGQNKEVLISNTYCEENARGFIQSVAQYFQDDRYIKIEGKPVLLVYEPELIENIRDYVTIWNEYTQHLGFAGVYLVAVEAMTLGVDPAEYHFDAAVEFAPDWTKTHLLSDRKKSHRIFDYKETVKNMLLKPEPPYSRFNCVFPSWDNTPRYKQSAITFVNNSPGVFKYFLERAMERTKATFPADRQFIFINAWNEWGEGCHLEPDERYGYVYLEIMRDLLRN